MNRTFRFLKKYPVGFILFAYLLILTQIRFTAWPEMLLWPYLMIKGWLPYSDIAIAHNPFLLLNLTFFYQILGVGLWQLKIFTWIVIVLSAFVTYWVAKKLYTEKVAAISLLFLIPLQIFYQTNGLWFDLFLSLVVPYVYYFYVKEDFFWTGFFWALAFLTKQTAVFLLLPIFLIGNLGFKKIAKKTERFLVGALTLFIPSLLALVLANVFADYLFWAFKFAGGLLPFSEGQIKFPGLREFLLGILPFFFALLLAYFPKKSKNSSVLWFFGAAAGMGVYPRWEYYHFLPAVPFLAILFAQNYSASRRIKRNQFLMFIFIGILLFISVRTIIRDFGKEARFFEPEVYAVEEYLSDKVSTSDAIFVLNSWDHFYVLTDTVPATKPWVPQLEWYLSLPDIEEQMLSSLIIDPPQFIIWHPYSEEGLDSYKPAGLSDFVERFYVPTDGFGDIFVLEKR